MVFRPERLCPMGSSVRTSGSNASASSEPVFIGKQANRACPGGQNGSAMKDTAQDTVFEVGWFHRSIYEKVSEGLLLSFQKDIRGPTSRRGQLIENKKRQPLGTAAFDTSYFLLLFPVDHGLLNSLNHFLDPLGRILGLDDAGGRTRAVRTVVDDHIAVLRCGDAGSDHDQGIG